ncbi:MAG: phage tail protein [Deltaproteobacteria bacterium]|jgi:hypothetical protein|nr:phage tail protein [Deltaproteobacteria bacterium]
MSRTFAETREAILNFEENVGRVDAFVNLESGYETNTAPSARVPSLREFMARLEGEAGSVVDKAELAADEAAAAMRKFMARLEGEAGSAVKRAEAARDEAQKVAESIRDIERSLTMTLSDSVSSANSKTAASSAAVKTAYDRGSAGITAAAAARDAAKVAREAADTAHKAAGAAQNTANAAQSAANEAKAGCFKVWTSAAQAFPAPGSTVLTHNLNLDPNKAFGITYMRCVTAEQGYAVGEEICALRTRSDSNGTQQVSLNPIVKANTVEIVAGRYSSALPVRIEAFSRTPQSFNLTPANWKLVIRIFY